MADRGMGGERRGNLGCVFREATLQAEGRALLQKLHGQRDAQVVLAVLLCPVLV